MEEDEKVVRTGERNRRDIGRGRKWKASEWKENKECISNEMGVSFKILDRIYFFSAACSMYKKCKKIKRVCFLAFEIGLSSILLEKYFLCRSPLLRCFSSSEYETRIVTYVYIFVILK